MAADISTAASSSRSGGGGASADSYIGSLISLTSKSEIRYEGILYNINTDESSIGLRNVRAFGTEGRKMDGPQVLPNDKVYEYILFRGSDIKDLQVKSSPPIQAPAPPPSINSDPAIIQSHYPRPTASPPSFPTAPSGSLTDIGPHSTQMGLPGSTFQGGLPLYQPGGNLNSWGPSPPNGNGNGLAVPMYWQGFYGPPNGMPQFPQQSLLRPPPGSSMPPSMQHMQYPGFNSSLPMGSSSLPSSSVPDFHSSLGPSSTSSSSLSSTQLPASNLPVNFPTLQPVPLQSQTINPPPNKAPISAISTSAPSSSVPFFTLNSTSVPDNVRQPPAANNPNLQHVTSALPPQNISQPVPVIAEMPTPSLVTPGQLLQSGPATGPATASLKQPLQTTHKDVEVVQVSPKPSPESSVPVVTEAQPPLLPLPQNTRAHKPNGGAYHMRNNYRGRGGRGFGISRPLTKFTEDFDFTAMNEKFNKDEVWGHLGKGNKEGNGSDNDEEYLNDVDDAESPKVENKTVYNKDDFFDSLSCNSMDNDPNHGNGRPRYSEQMKLDTETFGDFSRYRGGRGGRGPYRGGGGGRFRGSYYGRGYGGGYNNYAGRGRGRSTQNHPS